MSSASNSAHPGLAARDAARRGDIDYLIDGLEDPEMRRSAARHLGKLRVREAVPGLIRNLRASDDGSRMAAIKALGKIGDPAAVPALLEIAREDEAAGVRTQAIDSLARLGEPEGVEMFAQLAVDPSPLLATCARNSHVRGLRELQPKHLRMMRKWAVRRVRELHAIDAAPALTAALGTVDWRHRMRLRRTIKSLQG
jgi:HEAT repeat protein